MLKIAQVATSDVSIRLLLSDQIRALQEMGHEVTAVCAPGRHLDEIRARGIPVCPVEMAREISPQQDLRSLRALVRLFRSRGFDVVHTHTPKAGLLGPIAARLAGTPVVVHTIHGLLYHDRMPRWRQGLFWMPEKVTASCSDYLLSQSREDIAVAVRTGLCPPEKILYLGNGIDVAHFTPSPDTPGPRRHLERFGIGEDDVVVGSVGRLVYEKGFAELFAAAEALTTRHDRLKFVVVGPEETDQHDAVDPARMARLKRRGVVHFAGWQADMKPWYEAMDLFVLPSHREGIPRACMEAAAMACPVVASDIRGCREVVLHEETGLLVPVRDAEALAGAIDRLARDAPRRVQMGRRGRAHVVRNFSQEKVLARLRTFYTRIASDRTPANP